MKNIGLLVSLLFVVSFSGCDSITLALQLGPLVPSEQFNFNTSSSFYSCHDGNFTLCKEALLSLSPSIIRFPGGTDANYYHMVGKGYGYRLQRDCGTPADSGGDVGLTGNNPIDPTKDSSYPAEENVILTLVELVKATGAKVLFTLNMYDASFEENKEVIDFLMSQGCVLAGFELGNELYLDCYQDKFPNASTYLDSAIVYAGRLKTDYPNIPVGVVVAPSEKVGQMAFERREAYRAWNKLVKNKMNNFDAYTVHYYSGNNSVGCAPSDFDGYHIALQQDLSDWFGTSMAAYQGYFGTLPMWLTEWNTSTSQRCYGNSQLNNLFFAEYLCELASSHAAQVPIAVHHNWLGNGKHFPLLTWNGTSFQQKSAYPLFMLLKPIFEKRETYSILQPTSLAGSLPTGVKLYGYFQPPSEGNPARLLLAAINHNANLQAVNLNNTAVIIDGISYNLAGKKLTKLWSDALAATIDGTALGNSAPSGGEIQQAEIPLTDAISLPGYSVCLAELSLN